MFYVSISETYKKKTIMLHLNGGASREGRPVSYTHLDVYKRQSIQNGQKSIKRTNIRLPLEEEDHYNVD